MLTFLNFNWKVLKITFFKNPIEDIFKKREQADIQAHVGCHQYDKIWQNFGEISKVFGDLFSMELLR